MLTASHDLIALARSQIALITQTLGASSSVMYLTEEISEGMTPKLIEVASYPSRQEEEIQINSFLLPSAERSALSRQGRMVLPLIYEDTIVGFLTIGRDDRAWTEQEQVQIQQVVNTLAIACGLDRRCQWLAENHRQADIQQRDFIGTLLHQLRNPLTAIRTFAQLLLRRLLPEDPNRKILSGILRETGHIQDLLLEADRPLALLEPTREPIALPAADLELGATELSTILEPAIAAASAIAQDRNIQFSSHIPSNIPPVLANPSALREVLGNLIDNALKYTPPRGCVSLSVQVNPNDVVAIVQDTGVGIPAADMHRLFERNFRGRQAAGEIAGTGLGLAIAQDLAQKMQAEIQVHSDIDRGSTFAVILKRWAAGTS